MADSVFLSAGHGGIYPDSQKSDRKCSGTDPHTAGRRSETCICSSCDR